MDPPNGDQRQRGQPGGAGAFPPRNSMLAQLGHPGQVPPPPPPHQSFNPIQNHPQTSRHPGLNSGTCTYVLIACSCAKTNTKTKPKTKVLVRSGAFLT